MQLQEHTLICTTIELSMHMLELYTTVRINIVENICNLELIFLQYFKVQWNPRIFNYSTIFIKLSAHLRDIKTGKCQME